MPLYVFMFRAETDCSDVRIEPAYFNLPKAIEDTGPGIWEDFSQEICEDAVSCAQRVVGRITSYNVCYTKLLRSVEDQVVFVDAQGVACGLEF